MSIPDAPWVGKCREDYYGYEDEKTARCEDCDEEFDYDDLIEVGGRLLCKECHDYHCREEEEEAEDELHG